MQGRETLTVRGTESKIDARSGGKRKSPDKHGAESGRGCGGGGAQSIEIAAHEAGVAATQAWHLSMSPSSENVAPISGRNQQCAGSYGPGHASLAVPVPPPAHKLLLLQSFFPGCLAWVAKSRTGASWRTPSGHPPSSHRHLQCREACGFLAKLLERRSCCSISQSWQSQ